MPDKYTELFISELTTKCNTLSALIVAATTYVSIRNDWLEKKSDWRWGVTSGKLRFNRISTQSNVDAMSEIIKVLRNDNEYPSFYEKIFKIKMLKGKLTKGGHGRKLIEAWLLVTQHQTLSYIPHNLSSCVDSIVIGKHVCSKSWPYQLNWSTEAFLYENDDRTQRHVIKEIPQSSQSSLHNVQENAKKELRVLKRVYSCPNFYPKDKRTGNEVFEYISPFKGKLMSLPGGKMGKVACSIIVPPIDGYSLKQFALSKNFDQGKRVVFANMFSFLRKLHKTNIAHRDCCWTNVKIISKAYDVFLISYSTAVEFDEYNYKSFKDFMKEDLAMGITNVFKTIHYASRAERFIYEKMLSKSNFNFILKEYDLRYWVKGKLYNHFDAFYEDQGPRVLQLMKDWLGENKWAAPRPNVHKKMFGID
ncbi:MAG: hypothetical protein GY750_09535 [Lentisphaerae bacterium]|nr:hypothetical protein [Lentisphaerota bacterium]MCP4101654.1 hypothetical protein [Lentisphaerota bacterium]